jgi:hypothetical protein
MLTRLSQLLNALLVGAVVALPFGNSKLLGVNAKAEPGAETAAQPSKLEGRLLPQVPPPPASSTLPAVPAPPVEGKSDAVVPPLARKKPPAAPTSVPIVAPPDKKKGSAPVAAKGSVVSRKSAKPAPKPAAAQPADPKKAPTPPGRSSLGGPKSQPTAACAAGMSYDPRHSKCVKQAARAAPVAAPAPKPRQGRTPTAAGSSR